MTTTLRLRSLLAMGASAAALIVSAPALAQTAGPVGGTGVGPTDAGTRGNTASEQGPSTTNNTRTNPTTAGTAANAPSARVQELVVTAQRRSEAIQNVPVAVSAFSQESLKAQRLDGGQNLVLSVPNVNYSRSNFGGYNFQIRGIGTKVVASSGDTGVSINENNLPLQVNHFGDTDFYDVERVEVLRGPQGTLYGRSATGGAVNVITNKPSDRPSASITAEYGNYNNIRLLGYINAPLGDMLSLRLAGFYLNRDGYGTNLATGHDIDNRDLFSTRATLAFKPNDKFRAYLMWERFQEKDNRNRVGKQLCIKDPGPTNVLGVPTSPAAQGLLSQGCLPGSVYQDAAYGTLNTSATLGGILTNLVGLTAGDALANHPLQNHNLHDIESAIDPTFQASQNIYTLNMAYDLTNNLTLESITGLNMNKGSSEEDYNRLVALIPFNSRPASAATGNAYGPLANLLFPGGVVQDPQVGASNLFRSFDFGDTKSTERTEEIRLSSSFKGKFNFNIGFIYIDTKINTDYYVFSNGLTSFAQLNDSPILGGTGTAPYYVDPTAVPGMEAGANIGHNYYDSRSAVTLQTYGYFGEVYYDLTDDIKITAGVRYTDDTKTNLYYPIELLAGPTVNAVPNGTATGVITNPSYNNGRGFAVSQNSLETAGFTATTGRFNIDWKPHLSFTDQTLIYATYSRGYQGGGFNTPCQNATSQADFGTACGYPALFQPVAVNAYEIGTKNTLMGGRLVLNANAFYYDESGYQVSTIVNKASVNQNIDASIYGAELEAVFQPIRGLTFNANLGYLHTEIQSGAILDQLNLTQGDPSLIVVKASDGSNCVANRQGIATLLGATGGAPGTTLLGVCGSTTETAATMNLFRALGIYNYPSNVQYAQSIVNNAPAPNTYFPIGLGVPVNLKGKQLPNSPDFTVSLGAQYVFELPAEWRATIRGDYYWQDDSYARIFNTESDRLKGYSNVNATLNFDNRALGLNVQLFVKNVFNAQPITDLYLTDASSGLFENTFTLDPRTYGISVTKKF